MTLCAKRLKSFAHRVTETRRSSGERWRPGRPRRASSCSLAASHCVRRSIANEKVPHRPLLVSPLGRSDRRGDHLPDVSHGRAPDLRAADFGLGRHVHVRCRSSRWQIAPRRRSPRRASARDHRQVTGPPGPAGRRLRSRRSRVRWITFRLRRPVHWRRIGRGRSERRRVLPVRRGGAPLARTDGLEPQRRPRGDGRREPRIPVHRPERHLPLVAAQLDSKVGPKRGLVPTGTLRQGPRLQLAQRDRTLDVGTARDRRPVGRGHLVPVGRQPRLPHRRRGAPGAAWTRRPAVTRCASRLSAHRRSRRAMGSRRAADARMEDHQPAAPQDPRRACPVLDR